MPGMTRWLTAALAAVLLAGCSSGSTASAGRGSAADVHTHHRVYLQEMRRVLPGHSDARLDKLGESLCAAFRAGATWPDAVRHLIDDGLTASQAGAVIGSAVWQFCPKYQRVIPH